MRFTKTMLAAAIAVACSMSVLAKGQDTPGKNDSEPSAAYQACRSLDCIATVSLRHQYSRGDIKKVELGSARQCAVLNDALPSRIPCEVGEDMRITAWPECRSLRCLGMTKAVSLLDDDLLPSGLIVKDAKDCVDIRSVISTRPYRSSECTVQGVFQDVVRRVGHE